MKMRWPFMSQTQFILLFVGGGVQWWRRRFSERKKAEMGVKWSQSQHWKSVREFYEWMHYNSKVSYGWRWMHEHKGTNLAKRDCMRIIFWVVVLTLILSWRSVIEGWRYWERNGSRVEREQRDNTNYKKPWFFFTSEKGNLEFGTEFEFYYLVIWVWIKLSLART